MDRTICPSRRVVPIAALQQNIFNAGRAVLERVVRDPGRTTQVSLSLLLDTYVLFGMTFSLLLAFTLQRTEQRALRRTDDTRVDGCLSGRR